MRGARRVAVVVLVAALGPGGLVACSDTPSDTVTPASRNRPDVTATGPAEAVGGASATSDVPALPASELPELPGYTYVRAAGVPEVVPELDRTFVSGYVGRAIRRDGAGGAAAGVVQLVRLRKVSSTTDAFVDGFVEQYAQTTDFRDERLAGERVRTASRLRGRPGGLVTWRYGRDLVLVYSAAGTAAAKRVARACLEAAEAAE
jgi:hypothetical protein